MLCLLVLALLQVSCSQLGFGVGGRDSGLVVLDIGHSTDAVGAKTPGAVKGKQLSECEWWYQYVYYTKQKIEAAGYKCIVVNRGYAPTTEPWASYARRADVVQLKHPDENGARYPSEYNADRVAGGMVSADYAVSRNADCMVFLHHNSSSGRWTKGASPSLIICNNYNGNRLGKTLARTMNRLVLNKGMYNAGVGCTVKARYKDADRSAGWMNICDDYGIPAAVIECAFLNNRHHAAYLANDDNARQYAEAVGAGIVYYMRYFGNEKRHYRDDEDDADEGSFGYATESRRQHVPGARNLFIED